MSTVFQRFMQIGWTICHVTWRGEHWKCAIVIKGIVNLLTFYVSSQLVPCQIFCWSYEIWLNLFIKSSINSERFTYKVFIQFVRLIKLFFRALFGAALGGDFQRKSLSRRPNSPHFHDLSNWCDKILTVELPDSRTGWINNLKLNYNRLLVSDITRFPRLALFSAINGMKKRSRKCSTKLRRITSKSYPLRI